MAAAPELLTTAALLALQGELSRRQISIAIEPASFKGEDGRHKGEQVSLGLGLQRSEQQGVGDFVAEVIRTYHANFCLYFKIAAPAVIASTIAIVIAHHEVREFWRHVPRGLELLAHYTETHRAEMFEMSLINFSPVLVAWIAWAFAFGAICIALEESVAGFNPSAWNSFLNIRGRWSPFLRSSLLLLVFVLVAEGASVVLEMGVFWLFHHQWHVRAVGVLGSVVSYGAVALGLLVVSRFFLAIPAVLLDDSSVWHAMLRSDELTRGKWPNLAALLAKSLIGGYVAGMCPFWIASFVRTSVPLPSWFPWILTIASVIAVSVVEPPMFIGLALLYLKVSPTPLVAQMQKAGDLAATSAATPE